MSRHSPGPWTHCGAGGLPGCACGTVWDASGNFIVARCVLEDECHKKERETYLADMRLVAAAPELLEALVWLYDNAIDEHFAVVEAKRLAEVRAILSRIDQPGSSDAGTETT